MRSAFLFVSLFLASCAQPDGHLVDGGLGGGGGSFPAYLGPACGINSAVWVVTTTGELAFGNCVVDLALPDSLPDGGPMFRVMCSVDGGVPQ